MYLQEHHCIQMMNLHNKASAGHLKHLPFDKEFQTGHLDKNKFHVNYECCSRSKISIMELRIVSATVIYIMFIWVTIITLRGNKQKYAKNNQLQQKCQNNE